MPVDFQHWDFEVGSDLLSRYGSPHFSDNEAGKAVLPRLLSGATNTTRQQVRFLESHILCANEAYPEAALADPIADLRVWDEWCNGSRRFPYKGRFNQLGLTHQEQKTSSPSSVGVLGEVLAGLFSQAYVGPQMLVRCIRRWPDFIIQGTGNIFAFVEAKGFTGARQNKRLDIRIPEKLLREMLVCSLRQLNADPNLDVWGAFTGIVQIQPEVVVTVTMIRLYPPQSRRLANPRTELPGAVVEGVAERAVAQAAAKHLPAVQELFAMPIAEKTRLTNQSGDGRKRLSREDAEELSERAFEEVALVVTGAAPEVAVQGSGGEIKKAIGKLISEYTPGLGSIGRRFFEIKSAGEASVLQKVRKSGEEWIFMADLGEAESAWIESNWHPAWHEAAEPVTRCEGQPV